MKSVFAILLLTVGIVFNADASIWKWVDSNGDTHFVDSNRPIYTWVDDYGKAHYSDKPDHEDAISVQLVWVSSASLDEMTDDEDESGGVVMRTRVNRLRNVPSVKPRKSITASALPRSTNPMSMHHSFIARMTLARESI